MTPERDDDQLAFRPMAHEDLPHLRAWLEAPHVAEWWGSATETIDHVEAGFSERLDGDLQGAHWIVEADGRPVGFLQWHRLGDEPDWYPDVTIPAGVVGIDMAIGDPSLIGCGLGRRVLLEFTHHVVRARAPDSTEVWIDPNSRNERAMRAFRAAGFADTGIDLPDPRRPGEARRLMKLVWAGPTFR